MQRYISLVAQLIIEIGEAMPKGDMLTDADVTVLLELYKLRNAVLTEAIYFLGKYATKGDAANIKLLEGFKECKQEGVEVVREIEKSRVERGLPC
jgi:hypothetical protein